jgi:hypothetical protein
VNVSTDDVGFHCRSHRVKALQGVEARVPTRGSKERHLRTRQPQARRIAAGTAASTTNLNLVLADVEARVPTRKVAGWNCG